MCGRFTLKTPPAEWGQLLLPLLDIGSYSDQWQARFNIAPTQNIAAISVSTTGQPEIRHYRWGLIPFWANDLTIGSGMINARAETVAEKPAFRAALAKRRCAIIADGYYEWQLLEKGKQPYWIHLANGQPFAFAGLWETNRKATNHEVLSATIITTSASSELEAYHHRMPAVLSPEQLADWLSPGLTASEAQAMVLPCSTQKFVAEPVSTRVNSPRFDDAECIVRVTPSSPSSSS